MRLIDADEAIKNQWYGNSESIILRQYAVEAINNAPTVYAVPVVRCKDCKYRTWFCPNYGCGNYESPFYATADIDAPIMTKPDDFCSYGERLVEK